MADSSSSPSRAPGVQAGLARPGGLSYLEIPAIDPDRSARFYERVLGWKIEGTGSGLRKFQDPDGYLIGRWVTNRVISRDAGLLPYFYIEQIESAVNRVAEDGGTIVQNIRPEGNLWVATVRDPAGNLIGLWEEQHADQ